MQHRRQVRRSPRPCGRLGGSRGEQLRLSPDRVVEVAALTPDHEPLPLRERQAVAHGRRAGQPQGLRAGVDRAVEVGRVTVQLVPQPVYQAAEFGHGRALRR
ncbi:hypothetical protein ACFXPT_33135 [Streptomyces goshikiensis]|uniref:hypothetical protein n=1 Tax=Streptomyces goshikiensis TaxID=1942 RepID=UPI0036747E6D